MDKIIISSIDGTQTIMMPKTKDIILGADPVENKASMASGKTVKDITGFRITVDASWDYVPADTIVSLMSLLKRGGFFNVQYPSESGDAFGVFEMDPPSLESYKFKDGRACWHNVSLSMKAQEVI